MRGWDGLRVGGADVEWGASGRRTSGEVKISLGVCGWGRPGSGDRGRRRVAGREGWR